MYVLPKQAIALPADGRQCGCSPGNKTVTTVLFAQHVGMSHFMPRSARFATPKYRKHKGTGQAVVTIAGRDHNLGTWRIKGSLVEYDRLVGEWLAAGRPTSVATKDDLTTAELCRAYKRHAAGYYVRSGRLLNIASALRGLRLRYSVGVTPARVF